MAERKKKFKRCLSVLLVLDELEETEDRASKRGKTREWIRRRQESGYFTNIVTNRSIKRSVSSSLQRFAFCFGVFLVEVWSIFASSLADIFKLHWRQQTVSMATTEFAVTMRVRACNMLLRLAKRTKFHTSNMRTKEMLDDVGSNVWCCIKHVPTSSNTIQHVENGGQTIKCWFTQHVGSFNIYRLAGPLGVKRDRPNFNIFCEP